MSQGQGWDRRHLLGLEGLSAAELIELIDRAEEYRDIAAGRAPRLDSLAERTIANLFFEDSTRTRCSFTLAARRLGADTIDLTSAGSSVSKGETIVDTALNLQAMGVHGFIVRTSAAGGPHLIARALDQRHRGMRHQGIKGANDAESSMPGCLDASMPPVINAGDGRHEHPTQGLIDLMTLRQRLGNLAGKRIGIVGDIVSSRVARSALHGLTTLGANVLLIGPPALAPHSFERIASGPGQVSVHHDLDPILPELDAIMMLRVQFERQGLGVRGQGLAINPATSNPHPLTANPCSGDYRALYGLTAARAAKLPDHAIVLHPGPINRGLELHSEIADDVWGGDVGGGRSAILDQVTNGVAVRMAVLVTLLGPQEQKPQMYADQRR